MAFQWRKTVRKILTGVEKGKEKFYGAVSHERTVKLDEMANNLSKLYGYRPYTIKRVVQLLQEEIIRQMREGKIARIDELGTFRLNFSSKGCETAEELTLRSFSPPKLVFTPSQKLKGYLKSLTPKRAGDGKMTLR